MKFTELKLWGLIWASRVLYPMQLAVRTVRESSLVSRANLPSRSVETPTVEFLKYIPAKGTPLPVEASSTIPFTLVAWAKAS